MIRSEKCWREIKANFTVYKLSTNISTTKHFSPPFTTMKITAALMAVMASSATATKCSDAFDAAGVSDRFAETVAHAVHSLTVEDLKQFNPDVTEDNSIPTVPRDLTLVDGHAPEISHSAPSVPLPEGFSTDAMRTVDLVLASLGDGNDGLGDIWSNLERVVHMFHMKDLWSRINDAVCIIVSLYHLCMSLFFVVVHVVLVLTYSVCVFYCSL